MIKEQGDSKADSLKYFLDESMVRFDIGMSIFLLLIAVYMVCFLPPMVWVILALPSLLASYLCFRGKPQMLKLAHLPIIELNESTMRIRAPDGAEATEISYANVSKVERCFGRDGGYIDFFHTMEGSEDEWKTRLDCSHLKDPQAKLFSEPFLMKELRSHLPIKLWYS